MADMGHSTVLEYFLGKYASKNIQMNNKKHEKAWKSCLDMEATAQAYKDFQSRYLDKYSPTLGENLSKNFIGRIGEYSLDHALIQLYSHYGIIPSENNPFYIHMKNMDNIFPEFYERNIMDIAAGQIPALAEMIAGEQVKINAGTITAIDPELLITTTDPKYNKRLILLQKDLHHQQVYQKHAT